MGKRAIGITVSYLSVDQKGRATLPEDVRTSLGLRPGDFILLEKTKRGTYELVPAVLVPRDQSRLSHSARKRKDSKLGRYGRRLPRRGR